MNDVGFLWVKLAKLYESYFLCANRITDLCNYGLSFLKTKPASLLKSNLQLIQRGVSQFLSRWIELNKCVDKVIIRQGQPKNASNLLLYLKLTDDKRKTSSRMELIEQQIQNCMNSNDRPQKVNALIESWLRVRDETMACSKEKMILLESVLAHRNAKKYSNFPGKQLAFFNLGMPI